MTARTRLPAALAITFLALATPALGASSERKAPEEAFGRLKTYDYGQDRRPLFLIEALIDGSSSDPRQRAQITARLVAILEDAKTPKAARQFICRQLERIGTEAHLPVLAKLLGSPDTFEFARRALEAIPGDGASAALRAALPRCKGGALVGTINSLGERRDPNAVGVLAKLLGGPDAAVAASAARALGKIGTAGAAAALAGAEAKAPPPLRRAIWAAQLRCADRMAADGQPESAVAIYQQMAARKATRLRMAGLTGLAKTRGAKALPQLLDALASKEQQLQATAANLLATLPGASVAPALVERLPKLDPRGQALAVGILARAGGPEARKVMASLAQSPNEAVRVVAIQALASLGDASTVEALAKMAATGEGAARDAARQSLMRLTGPKADAAILAAAAKGDWRTRVELLDAAVARRIPNAVPALMKAATDGHHAVRLAGFKGLRAMAGAEHYPALVKLLVDAPTVADIQAAQKALLAAAKTIESLDAKVGPILAAMKGVRPEVKVAMLQALSRCGGPKALQAIRESLKDARPKVQDAAVRALAGWKDAAVAGDLLKLSSDSPNQTHRMLALRGCLRLARQAAGESPEASLKMLEQLRGAAKDAAAKKMLLAAVADLNTPGALTMAASLVGDQEVVQEALLATFTLARALKTTHPKAVEAAMARVLKASKDPDAIRQANILLGKTSFVTLFDGKTTKGWLKPFDWGTVSVKDGAIHLQGNKKFFLVSEKTYGDFILEAEAHLDEGANSGIQYRSHYEKNRLWGCQADVDSLPRGWRGIYDETPGRGWLARGDAKKAEKLYKKTWNRYRIECIGDRTRFLMNGELIVDHLDPMDIEGHIALQHHGEKGKVVRYRNIRIMDLGKRRWLPLINETSFAKWESNGVGKWTIEKGVINGRKSSGGHALLYGPRVHKDFCIRFKVKAVRGNAGFYIRSEKLPGVQGARGLAVEIDPARDQSGLFETHGRNWVGKPDQAVLKKHFRKGDWNEMAVCALGGRLLVYLNGHKTVDLPADRGRPTGHLALGLHGGTVHTQFKDLVILSD